MKKLSLFILTIAFIFSFDVSALADEGHSHKPNLKQATENLKDGSTNNQDASSGDDSTLKHDSESEMEGMDHDSGDDLEDESSGEVHDHHAAVVETPPNYKVLGTYGTVNLLFILIGVWNKWFRRKGDLKNDHA